MLSSRPAVARSSGSLVRVACLPVFLGAIAFLPARGQATLYGIGDLPGGPVYSIVWDAVNVGGVIKAVGGSTVNTGGTNIPDTNVLWTSTGGLTVLPSVVANPTASSSLASSTITRDGQYIAGPARAGVGGTEIHAVRTTVSGLVNLDLGTLPGFPQFAAAYAMSEDGAVFYGPARYLAGGKTRMVRYTVAGPTVTTIPFLNAGDDTSRPASRAISTDGSITIGTSTNSTTDAFDGITGTGPGNRAFRFVQGSGVTAIPTLAGGTWNMALALSPDGKLAAIGGDSASAPNGEIYLYNFATGVSTSLGTPNGSRRTNVDAGMTPDGAVVAVTFTPADNTTPGNYIRNANGWHEFSAVVARAGVNLTGWTFSRINGMSSDGTLVFGRGIHNGNSEGFIVQFPAGYLAAVTEPAIFSTPNATLVGAWTFGGSGQPTGALIFLSSGYYFHIQQNDVGDSTGATGFERGQYTWNASTGAVTFNTLFDANGDIGLSGISGVVGVASASVVGDTLTYTGPDGVVVLQRVTGTSPIVGAFAVGTQADNSTALIFLPNGFYLFAQDGDAVPTGDPSSRDGMEIGTYTWNSTSGLLTTTQLLDSNPAWGFSRPQSPRTVRISSDLKTFSLTSVEWNFTLPRVEPTADVAVIVPGVDIPRLMPAGATTTEARALTEVPGGAVIVAESGSYAVRPAGGAQAITLPNYTNPQPYNLSYVVRLLANGEPDPAFTSAPGGDGTVNTVVVQADGKILVGGTFTTFNGVLFRNLARLNADGKPDATFALGSGVDAQVNAIAVQADGKILVGGLFQNYQALPRPYLLRLSDTGVIDLGFTPAVNGAVDAIVVQADGKILVGGNFTSAGGASRNRVARLLASGAIDPSFDPGTGASDEVVTLRVQANGAVIAGGDFTSFAGQNRGRVARLLSTGALDPAFAPALTANGTVISLGLEPAGNIVLGGAFTQVNGVARNRVARLLPDGTLDLTFDPGDGANKDVRAVLPRNDGTIFLGGLFDQFQGTTVDQVVAITGTPVTTAFLQAPLSLTANLGTTARFIANVTGAALSYQWFKDGVAIAGATTPILAVSGVNAAAQGHYTLQVTSADGSSISGDATLTVVNGGTSQIVNLSVLTSLDASGATFTLGFVIGGAGTSGAKPLLVRAAGPALAQFGVGNPLADPKLQFYTGSTLAGQNDDWKGGAALSALMTQVGAFPYTDANSKDAAFAASANLTTPSNSVVVSGGGDTTGAVLAEVYDATPSASSTATTPRLTNVSVLKGIPSGATLTAGFVISGSVSKTVLVRAIGPTLSAFGVDGPLSDPQLTLFSGQTVISTNDNWGGSAAVKAAMDAVGAFALDAGSKDAAILITLPPGGYTAQASGVGGAAGAALVEVYEVP